MYIFPSNEHTLVSTHALRCFSLHCFLATPHTDSRVCFSISKLLTTWEEERRRGRRGSVTTNKNNRHAYHREVSHNHGGKERNGAHRTTFDGWSRHKYQGCSRDKDSVDQFGTHRKMAPGAVLCPVEAVGEVRTAGADTNE